MRRFMEQNSAGSGPEIVPAKNMDNFPPFLQEVGDKKQNCSHNLTNYSPLSVSARPAKFKETSLFDDQLMDQIEELYFAGESLPPKEDDGGDDCFDTPNDRAWSPTKLPSRKKKSKWASHLKTVQERLFDRQMNLNLKSSF